MRRTKEDAEKTKESILDAAVDVFAREGYENSTLDQVARQAGVTKGAIYWHFRDKADLYQKINEREHNRIIALLEAVLVQKISPFHKVRQLAYAILDNFYENLRFRNFIELTWYKSSVDKFNELLTKFKTGFVQDFISQLESLLESALRAGEVKNSIDHRHAALHIACLINGIYRLYVVAPDRARRKQDAIDVFDDYFDSIAAESKTSNDLSNKG